MLVGALIAGASCEALADVTGLNIRTVRRYVKALRDRETVFRSGWLPVVAPARRPVAVYRLRLSRFEKDAPAAHCEASVARMHRAARQVAAV